jgi:hypothetical protein
MDAGANDAPALANRLQRQRDEVSNGREYDRSIEQLRRRLVGAARPGGTESPGEGLGGDVSGPGKAKYRSLLPSRDLRYDMGCGAEAVEAQLLAIAGDH